jgi:hypothetical protein
MYRTQAAPVSEKIHLGEKTDNFGEQGFPQSVPRVTNPTEPLRVIPLERPG